MLPKEEDSKRKIKPNDPRLPLNLSKLSS